MSADHDDIPLRPIAAPETVRTRPKTANRPQFKTLSLWAQIAGLTFAIISGVVALRAMFGDFPLQGSPHAVTEIFSTVLLFLFLGSFGIVPGLLLFWWGRALIRDSDKVLLAYLPILFSLPFWVLAIFFFIRGGAFYGSGTVIFALFLCVLGLYVWRRQPKSPPTQT